MRSAEIRESLMTGLPDSISGSMVSRSGKAISSTMLTVSHFGKQDTLPAPAFRSQNAVI